ncbi:MAG: hypothetical protein ABFE13_09950, partial [Phycisphaerales bacterium]
RGRAGALKALGALPAPLALSEIMCNVADRRVNCDFPGKPVAKRWYVVDVVLFGGFAVAYAALWRISLLANYLDGLSNGGRWLLGLLGFCGLGILLVVWFFALLVRMLTAWLTHIRSWRRLVLLCTLTLIALAAWVGAPFGDLWPPGYVAFTHGFRRYMRTNGDLDAIRGWLITLDPNLCTERYIDLCTGNDFKPRWPDTVAWPEAITRFEPHYVQLIKTETRRPKVRLTWGGALGHWGVEIGPEDMPIPETLPRRRSAVQGRDLWDEGEYRLPLAPGAYVWHEIQ